MQDETRQSIEPVRVLNPLALLPRRPDSGLR